MKSWHSYPKVYNLGHAAITELTKGPVIIEEKLDGCVAIDTPILCSDLIYRRAGSLDAGDAVVGFTENPVNVRLRTTMVTHNGVVIKPCLRVTTTQGSVIATEDHPWLVRLNGCRVAKSTHAYKAWIMAKDLLPGDLIVSLPRWETDHSWGAGYLAGQFDGEGTLVRCGDLRRLAYYQTPGAGLELVEALLTEKGFRFGKLTRNRGGGCKDNVSLTIKGGWPRALEFLGRMRPARLLEKAHDKLWNNAPTNGIGTQEVLSVEPVGYHKVAALSTETGTYVAKGLFSHNSQISFGFLDGELKIRSKGAEINPDAPEKMFAPAIEVIKELASRLTPGWTYRGEYLRGPKHNVIKYDRVPQQFIAIFDINFGDEKYVPYDGKLSEAQRLGFECAPLLAKGNGIAYETLQELLEKTSMLGGSLVEGVVIKPQKYDLFGRDGKVLMGKYVSEKFKEKHASEWKKANPQGKDILGSLIAALKTEARWEKAKQHLQDEGKLLGEPKDIGGLIKEVQRDVFDEEVEWVKEQLFKWAEPHLRRGVVGGVAEWYKELLAEGQFDEVGN